MTAFVCSPAQVVKWQTRWLQVPVLARAWRFNSSPGHLPRNRRTGWSQDRPFCIRLENRRHPMDTARLRALIRKYGEFGVLLVALYLLAHHLWHRQRAALALLVALFGLSFFCLPRPLDTASRLPQEEAARAAYTLTEIG